MRSRRPAPRGGRRRVLLRACVPEAPERSGGSCVGPPTPGAPLPPASKSWKRRLQNLLIDPAAGQPHWTVRQSKDGQSSVDTSSRRSPLEGGGVHARPVSRSPGRVCLASEASGSCALWQALRMATEVRPTDQRHTFFLGRPRLMLRLRVLDRDYQPNAHAPCTLHFDALSFDLETDGQRRIELPFLPAAERAMLMIFDDSIGPIARAHPRPSARPLRLPTKPGSRARRGPGVGRP